MLKRMAALLMVLLFAGQAMAGGIVCSLDAINNGLSPNNEAACPMEGTTDCDEMACCALGTSPTGSMAAMICCETVCGESTSGAQFNFTPQTITLAPPVVAIRVISLVSLDETATSTASVSMRSAENHRLHYHPPAIFLSHSAFLI
jgi:hypothetical protein